MYAHKQPNQDNESRVRILYVLCMLAILHLFPECTIAQSDTLPNPQPSFVALIVSDIDSSISWYSTHLGFEVLNRVELEERGLKQSNLKRANFYIELIELENAIHPSDVLGKHPPRTRIAGIFKFGFSVRNFDSWIKHLQASEVTFNGQVVTDPISQRRMIIVNDPDGNRIQIFEQKG